MNPKIAVGKLRNRRTGKGYTLEDVRPDYNWSSVSSFEVDGKRYNVYRFDKNGRKPVPRNGDIGLMKPPIWEGRLNEAPVKFYSDRESGELRRDIGKAAAGLYNEWGEGIYQVQRYPDKKVPTIQNLFKPALVKKIE